MFRIALIIAALVSGHHHVTVTHQDGRGYMTTQLACTPKDGVPLFGRPTRILCVDGHTVIKTRFARRTVSTRMGLLDVRRAYVFNAEGRLSGWVDWTFRSRAIGHVLFRQGLVEVWQ